MCSNYTSYSTNINIGTLMIIDAADVDHAAVGLAGDVNVLVEDLVDLEHGGGVLATRELITERLTAEVLRIVTSEQDVRRAELGDFLVHLDLEVIDREAELCVAQEPEGRGENSADHERLRSFGLKYAQTTLREDGRGDAAAAIVTGDAIGRAVCGHALRNRTGVERRGIVHARIDPVLSDEARFVRLEQFEQGRCTERCPVRTAEADPVGHGPVQANLIGEVAVVAIGHAIDIACCLNVGHATRCRERQLFEERTIGQKRGADFCKGFSRHALAGGDAAGAGAPRVGRTGDLAGRIVDLVFATGDAER
mgnify:CR=1 FL=1